MQINDATPHDISRQTSSLLLVSPADRATWKSNLVTKVWDRLDKVIKSDSSTEATLSAKLTSHIDELFVAPSRLLGTPLADHYLATTIDADIRNYRFVTKYVDFKV
jgi:hypothetical protein